MPGSFLISLDFELFWGMRDKTTIESYGPNILGVRAAIPAMLEMFRRHQVHVTWAAVGMLLFDSRRELRKYLPHRQPKYTNPALSPYPHLDQIGDDERSDPYHYGLSIARKILSIDGMELASHTFSHYYCLEPGQNAGDFRADLESSIAATERLGVRPASLVFPRNQFNRDYMTVCSELGFRAFRGNQRNWMYREAAETLQRGKLRRAAQLLDTYLDLSGDNAFAPHRVDGMINLPASRFLRPFQQQRRAFEGLRLNRIRSAMTSAALFGNSLHLWWHPHNFGTDLNRNVAFLAEILKHYTMLRDRYDMSSLTMQEAADVRLGIAA